MLRSSPFVRAKTPHGPPPRPTAADRGDGRSHAGTVTVSLEVPSSSWVDVVQRGQDAAHEKRHRPSASSEVGAYQKVSSGCPRNGRSRYNHQTMAKDDPFASDYLTSGIRVQVTSKFLAAQSAVDTPPQERRWAFAYTVTITNEGQETVTLVARHWVITDGNGAVEHVRGPGVIGFQPTLQAGQAFTYSSGAVLRTPQGVMHGEYLMERTDGSRFAATIAPFALVTEDVVQ
jgi:ApaG protein